MTCDRCKFLTQDQSPIVLGDDVRLTVPGAPYTDLDRVTLCRSCQAAMFAMLAPVLTPGQVAAVLSEIERRRIK